jgi:hypothetical protein
VDVNPSYMAVTFWFDDRKPEDKPLRAENLDAQKGREKTDLLEFLTRHLPAIMQLPRHEVYVGMPGRIYQPATPLPAAFQAEPVGECLVAGVGVYDAATEKKVGGVASECNLERVLFDHLNLPTSRGCELFLTNEHGRCFMRFTRETGLRPIDPVKSGAAITPLVRAFFEDQDSVPVTAISATLCAAKVPLSHQRSEHFMGLVLKYPE